MNKDTLKMMEKIDDRFIEEALTNDDVECLNESRGVKKYTVMRYAAACLIGLAGIGAAAFGIVKMNGGGKGTENVGIVGEVTENESTKEEAIQKPTIVPNKIVINKSEAPKENQIVDNNESDRPGEPLYKFESEEEYYEKIWESNTYMTRPEMFKYYELEKFEEIIDGVFEEVFGEEMECTGNQSVYDAGCKRHDYYGICQDSGSIFDVNSINYESEQKHISILFERNTNCYRPLGKPMENFEYKWLLSCEYEDGSREEAEKSEIFGKEVYIINFPNSFKEYCAAFDVGKTKIYIDFFGCEEDEVVELIEKIIEKGI